MDAQDVNGKKWFDFQPDQLGGATDKGPRRAENQDAYWIPDQNIPADLGVLFMVADGVGGQQDGAVASKSAVETVSKVFFDLRKQGEPIPSALKNSLEKANQVILAESEKRQVRKMGSTFVGVVLDGKQMIVAHVGDARAYLIRQGELRQLTRDDTWVQRQVDAGLITEEEASRHEFRNVVTQVLGNKPEINVNLSKSQTMQPGDALLLCSDGLYDVLSDSRMASLINENSPQQGAKLLVEAAVDAEATDNITAVVMRTGDFIPLADEPTLSAIPAAMAMDDTITAASVESAPTMITTPPPPPPLPAAAEKKGGISKWLIILAIIAVLLIIGTILAFWLRSNSFAEDVNNAAETAVPPTEEVPAVISTGALKPLVPEETATATEEPTATSTATPLPDTPTPRVTETEEADLGNRACIDNDAVNPFLWDENQVRTGTCDSTQVGLSAGAEVRIVGDQPLVGTGACERSNYIKVQSVDEITKVGWISEALITPLEPGESCGP